MKAPIITPKNVDSCCLFCANQAEQKHGAYKSRANVHADLLAMRDCSIQADSKHGAYSTHEKSPCRSLSND